MTKEQIDQAFEGRWRIKGNWTEDMKMYTHYNVNGVIQSMQDHIKDLCRDFFTAGIMIAEKATVPEVSTSGNTISDATFETWWKLYDLKVGKEKCMQKWAKMTVKEREACIAATPAYVASTPDKQFRKRPLTYLNQKAWNDEIIPHNNGTDKPTIDQQRTDKLASILTE